MFEPVNVFTLDNTLELIPNVKYKIGKESRIRSTNDWEDPLHSHDFYEIFLNLSSDATIYIDGKYYPLTYGTPFIIKPQQLHVCKFHKIQKHEFFCFWLGEKTPSSLLSFFNQPDLSPVYELEDSVKQTMIDLFFTLYNFSNAENCEIEKASCFLNILKIFKQHASTTNEYTTELPQQLSQIVNYIQNNSAEIAHIKNVAEKYFLSPSTLNRWFRKYLHTTPHEYLEMCKLKHAEKLLLSGSSVTEAYSFAGFPDCSHFIALFRKKYGVTPLQYKRTITQNSKKQHRPINVF